jgi:hypothetical protein
LKSEFLPYYPSSIKSPLTLYRSQLDANNIEYLNSPSTKFYLILARWQAFEKRDEEAGMYGASERKSEAYTEVR